MNLNVSTCVNSDEFTFEAPQSIAAPLLFLRPRRWKRHPNVFSLFRATEVPKGSKKIDQEKSADFLLDL